MKQKYVNDQIVINNNNNNYIQYFGTKKIVECVLGMQSFKKYSSTNTVVQILRYIKKVFIDRYFKIILKN